MMSAPALTLAALVPLAALASDPRTPCGSIDATIGTTSSPSMQASLDGTHFESIPIKRWQRDTATRRWRLVIVPPAQYKSMRWSFAAPPDAALRDNAEKPAP